MKQTFEKKKLLKASIIKKENNDYQHNKNEETGLNKSIFIEFRNYIEDRYIRVKRKRIYLPNLSNIKLKERLNFVFSFIQREFFFYSCVPSGRGRT